MRALPETDKYPPALLVAYGVPNEPEPGLLEMPAHAVRAVQLVRLKPDGTKIDGEPKKITIGRPSGVPMVIASINDGLGLWITEGPEDALSILARFEVGIWAAGGAPFLPALADTVPAYVECVRVLADHDVDGEAYAHQLIARLAARDLHAELVFPDGCVRVA